MELNICNLIGIHENFIVNFEQESQMGRLKTDSQFKRDVVKMKVPTRKSVSPNKLAQPPGSTQLHSEVDSFRAFAEMNEALIQRQRHVRFYTTLLLKDLLSDAPIDKVAEFYSLTFGEIQAFQ